MQIRSFDASVNRWWNEQLDAPFPSDVSVRLQTLREDVYDYLEELGHIIKAPGQTSPIHVAPEGRGRDLADEPEITVTKEGAFYGDPATNRLVEQAAVDAAIAHFAGWTVDDVSKTNCGWDLTFTRGTHQVHAEVKGVSGRTPRILLTRNEFDVAGRDADWRLFVVTRALVDPRVSDFTREEVTQHAAAHVYKVALRSVR